VKLVEANHLVDSWLAQPCATIVHPTDRHSRLMRELLSAGDGGGCVR
jgi:uncharacterized protein